jgi:hypothetical protein
MGARHRPPHYLKVKDGPHMNSHRSTLRRLRKEVENLGTEQQPEDEREREMWRSHIRHSAESANRSRQREGLEPIFEITEDGTVYTFDGRLVDDYHQSGAEHFYWMQVAWGGPGLVHDEEAEAFYTPDGELAVSRTHFDIRHLLNH